MAIKEVLVCDCCGSEITSNQEHYNLSQIRREYQIIFDSQRFTDAAGSTDSKRVSLDLCRDCCERGVLALEKIARDC